MYRGGSPQRACPTAFVVRYIILELIPYVIKIIQLQFNETIANLKYPYASIRQSRQNGMQSLLRYFCLC